MRENRVVVSCAASRVRQSSVASASAVGASPLASTGASPLASTAASRKSHGYANGAALGDCTQHQSMHDFGLPFGGVGQVFFGHIAGSENPIGLPMTNSQLLQNPPPESPVEASAVSFDGVLLVHAAKERATRNVTTDSEARRPRIHAD